MLLPHVADHRDNVEVLLILEPLDDSTDVSSPPEYASTALSF